MLTHKHTGFVHTVLYLKSQRKLLKFDYNCPPPVSTQSATSWVNVGRFLVF